MRKTTGSSILILQDNINRQSLAVSVNICRLKYPAIRPKMSQKQETERRATGQEDGPKFGRLLIVLLFAVAVIVALTFATEAYYSN